MRVARDQWLILARSAIAGTALLASAVRTESQETNTNDFRKTSGLQMILIRSPATNGPIPDCVLVVTNQGVKEAVVRDLWGLYPGDVEVRFQDAPPLRLTHRDVMAARLTMTFVPREVVLAPGNTLTYKLRFGEDFVDIDSEAALLLAYGRVDEVKLQQTIGQWKSRVKRSGACSLQCINSYGLPSRLESNTLQLTVRH